MEQFSKLVFVQLAYSVVRIRSSGRWLSVFGSVVQQALSLRSVKWNMMRFREVQC